MPLELAVLPGFLKLAAPDPRPLGLSVLLVLEVGLAVLRILRTARSFARRAKDG